MAKNLDFDTLNDTGSWCYNDTAANCDAYGRLYNWTTLMGYDTIYLDSLKGDISYEHQGICPAGWHVPSANEWNLLISYVGGYSGDSVAIKLESKTLIGIETFNFSLGLFGYRDSTGTFTEMGSEGRFWESSETGTYIKNVADAIYAWKYLDDLNNFEDWTNKREAFSLRCLKNY
jgi:uncharacterized protein (TIGR02145 family)